MEAQFYYLKYQNQNTYMTFFILYGQYLLGYSCKILSTDALKLIFKT